MGLFIKLLKGISGMFWQGYRSYSQFSEDLIITKLFKNVSTGFYVDIGAFHPKVASNTYKLYKKGWSGLNVDAEKFKMVFFKIFRNRCINIQALITDKDNEEIFFYSPIRGSYGSMASIYLNNGEKINYEKKKLISSRISTLLENLMIDKIDLLTIDIEGLDEVVLYDFDFTKFTPKVICIEMHHYEIEKITNSNVYRFLVEKNYKLHSWVAPSLIFSYHNGSDNND